MLFLITLGDILVMRFYLTLLGSLTGWWGVVIVLEYLH